MKNDELKKKIVEVVLNSEITGIQIRAITGGGSTANSIADSLIAAGLRFGENLTATFDHMALEREHELEHRLAEAEHRAEVAEMKLELMARGECTFASPEFYKKQAEKRTRGGGDRMTEQKIELCLERFATCKATDVMNFDYAGTLAYIERLKAENAALRDRLDKAVVNGKRFIVEKQIDGREVYVVCRYKVIKSYICTEYTREAAEARLAEPKGGGV